MLSLGRCPLLQVCLCTATFQPYGEHKCFPFHWWTGRIGTGMPRLTALCGAVCAHVFITLLHCSIPLPDTDSVTRKAHSHLSGAVATCVFRAKSDVSVPAARKKGGKTVWEHWSEALKPARLFICDLLWGWEAFHLSELVFPFLLQSLSRRPLGTRAASLGTFVSFKKNIYMWVTLKVMPPTSPHGNDNWY